MFFEFRYPLNLNRILIRRYGSCFQKVKKNVIIIIIVSLFRHYNLAADDFSCVETRRRFTNHPLSGSHSAWHAALLSQPYYILGEKSEAFLESLKQPWWPLEAVGGRLYSHFTRSIGANLTPKRNNIAAGPVSIWKQIEIVFIWIIRHWIPLRCVVFVCSFLITL